MVQAFYHTYLTHQALSDKLLAVLWYTIVMTAPAVEKKAYFIRKQNAELHEELKSSFPLFGSDAFAAGNGDILYITFHDLKKIQTLPSNYILVSQVNSNADIYAAHSRTKTFKELRINRVTDGVETAIRAMDHIMEGESAHETPQAQMLTTRAHELFDLFSDDYGAITPEKFVAARQKTYALLMKVDLDPDLIVSEEKQRITEWLIKGSYGKDILGRSNRLVTLMSLSAAYRHAIERQKGIGTILGKFVRMREALVFERNFSRTLFTEVESRLRPTELPAVGYFTHPSGRTYKAVGNILGLLETTKFQLRQSHVNPYKEQGKMASEIITEIMSLIREDRRNQVEDRQLFSRAQRIVGDTLTKYSLIYPTAQDTTS